MTHRFIRMSLVFGLAAIFVVGCGKKSDKPENPDKKDSTSSSSSSSSTSDAKGEEVSSAGGKFSLTLPPGFSKPVESTMPIKSAVGNLDMKVQTSSKDTSSIIMTAYIDYPDLAFAKGTDVMLDSAQQGAMKNLNGVVEKQEDISIDGNPGRSLIFAGETGGTKVYGRVDYYLVKPRLYQVLFLSQHKDMVDADDIKSTFSSFKLTK